MTDDGVRRPERAVIASPSRRRPRRTRPGPVLPAGAALHCPAPHPDGERRDVYSRLQHGERLPAVLPFPVRSTRRVLSDFGEVREGCIGVRCSCGAVIEYQPVESPMSEVA